MFLPFRMWTPRNVWVLQRAARSIPSGDVAVLAAANATARKVSRRVRAAAGQGAVKTDGTGSTVDLGARRIGGRSGGLERRGGGAEADGSRSSRAGIDHYRHGTKTCRASFWSAERLLFSARLRICDSSLSGGATSRVSSGGGNGVLAELSQASETQRGAGGGHQLTDFRPLVSRLSTISLLPAAGAR